MLYSKPITKKAHDFKDIIRIYQTAFPKSEQAPVWFLFSRAKKKNIEFNAYYEDDTLVGITYITVKHDIVYIMYLAVNDKLRSSGYGSKILQSIREQYPNYRVILNIETEDEKAENNEQRKRRKSFYFKNGFESTNIIGELKGALFELLVCNGKCTADDFLDLQKETLGTLVNAMFKPTMHNI